MARAAKTEKKQKPKRPEKDGAAAVPMPALEGEHLDISMLETWLWDAACAIRGSTDAPKFKDFILPLIFFKRLSDVFDDEFAGQVKEFGDEEIAREVIKADHEDALKTGRRPIVRFFVPHQYQWEAIRNGHSAFYDAR
jgi:type I restriction enzyme M protein